MTTVEQINLQHRCITHYG